MTLRRLRKHALAVETRCQRIVAYDVAGFDDLRGRRNACDIELGQRVHVTEKIAELPPEYFYFFIGQRKPRELSDVAYVDCLGGQGYEYSS